MASVDLSHFESNQFHVDVRPFCACLFSMVFLTHLTHLCSLLFFYEAMTGINCDGLATRFADREGQKSCKTWLILCGMITVRWSQITATSLSGGSIAVLISDRWKHAGSQEGQDRVLCRPQGPCRPGDAKVLTQGCLQCVEYIFICMWYVYIHIYIYIYGMSVCIYIYIWYVGMYVCMYV